MIRICRLTIIVLTLIIFGYSSLLAQINYSSFFTEHQLGYRSLYAPSYLGKGFETYSVQLPSGNIWEGNSFMRDQKLWDPRMAPKEVLKEENKLVSLNDNNISGYGGEVFLSYATKIRKDTKELFSLSFGIRYNEDYTNTYSKNVFKVLLEGNRQFAGEEIQLSSEFTGIEFTEYFIGGAVPLSLSDQITIRTGFRLSYISSHMVNLDSGKATLYTAPNGQYLVANSKVEKRFHRNLGMFKYKLNGQGFGVDAGLTIDVGKKLTVSTTAKNLGNIKFNINDNGPGAYSFNNTYNTTTTDTLKRVDFWNPYPVAKSIAIENSTKNNPSSFNSENDSKRNKFNTNLGPELLVDASYRIDKEQHKTNSDTNNYYIHNIYIIYKQGFQNKFGTTTRPEVNVAYMYNLNSIFNVGINAGIGGFNAYNAGVFASIRGGPFVFSLASNNILGAIPKAGTGFDASMSMALNF